ncbi:MAG: shikimate dehydrogenase [Pseudanabaenaceae cyanobacterium]
MTPRISGTTKILGVMGYPVTYSLSPVMHNRALEHLGLDYVYVPLPVPMEQFSVAIRGLFACESIMGFNLTIPHKQEILPYLVDMTPLARTVGAVNTVKRSEKGWVGTNTDVDGFIYPLQSSKLQLQKAVILGSGGAAKAVIVGCQKLGIQNITAVGRSLDKLEILGQQFNIHICPWAQLDQALENIDLLVNCTPVGMDNQSPLTPGQIAQLPPTTIVYDLLYTPRPTPLPLTGWVAD